MILDVDLVFICFLLMASENVMGKERRVLRKPSKTERNKSLTPKPKIRLSPRQQEKKILDDILNGKVYDPRIRPSAQDAKDGPTKITANVMIRTIEKIDDVRMEYSIQITFRQQWYDDRLEFAEKIPKELEGGIKYLTIGDAKRVWMPDTFFRNEKTAKSHTILVPNFYIRIFPNGDVLYSVRVSLTLACPMRLELYPLDQQQCSMQVASYGWATDDLVYLWKDDNPVQLGPGIQLPTFIIAKLASDYCNVITSTGEYSCLTMDLTFERQFSYYLLTIFIPTCILVIVSWLSFWIDPGAAPARVALGVTTLLTMSTKTASINAALPPVAYTKAVDVWTGVCTFFVFFALFEYTAVNAVARSDKKRAAYKKQKESEKDKETEAKIKADENIYCEISLNAIFKPKGKKKSLATRAKKIDLLSRVTFPFVFLIFNIIYWSYYLYQQSKYFDDSEK